MKKLDLEMQELQKIEALHEQYGKRLFEACDSTLFPMDGLTLTALDRSLCLINGFSKLITNNYTCAIPILRMQLDSLLRYHAFMLVNDPHKFANEVLNGIEIRKLKDNQNKKMTDAYLVEKLSENNPWVTRVYKFSCGFVHFSEAHFMSLVKKSEGKGNSRKFFTGSCDKHVPYTHRFKAICAFNVITRGFLKVVDLWIEKERQKYDFSELKNKYTIAV